MDDHTGENLKEFSLEIFAEWGLNQDQLVAITKDDGVNSMSTVAVEKT